MLFLIPNCFIFREGNIEEILTIIKQFILIMASYSLKFVNLKS